MVPIYMQRYDVGQERYGYANQSVKLQTGQAFRAHQYLDKLGNGDGVLTKDELSLWTQGNSNSSEYQWAKQLGIALTNEGYTADPFSNFKEMDLNGDGAISAGELARTVGNDDDWENLTIAYQGKKQPPVPKADVEHRDIEGPVSSVKKDFMTRTLNFLEFFTGGSEFSRDTLDKFGQFFGQMNNPVAQQLSHLLLYGLRDHFNTLNTDGNQTINSKEIMSVINVDRDPNTWSYEVAKGLGGYGPFPLPPPTTPLD